MHQTITVTIGVDIISDIILYQLVEAVSDEKTGCLGR